MNLNTCPHPAERDDSEFLVFGQGCCSHWMVMLQGSQTNISSFC